MIAAILLLFAQVHMQVQAGECPDHCSEERIAAYESHISVTWSIIRAFGFALAASTHATRPSVMG